MRPLPTRMPSRIYPGNEPEGPIHPLLAVALVISLVAAMSALDFFAQLAGAGDRSFDSAPFLVMRATAST